MSSNVNSIDLSGFSKQYAARDLPALQKLKYRDVGQAMPSEVRKNKREMRRELDEREKLAANKDKSKYQLSLTEKESSVASSSSSSSKKPK